MEKDREETSGRRRLIALLGVMYGILALLVFFTLFRHTDLPDLFRKTNLLPLKTSQTGEDEKGTIPQEKLNDQKVREESQNEDAKTEPRRVIKKGEVLWQAPKEIGDIGMTEKVFYRGGKISDTDTSFGAHYFRVGTVTSGAFLDAEVLLFVAHMQSDFPGPFRYFFRILRKGNESWILLPSEGSSLQEKTLRETVFREKEGEKISYVSDVAFEELSFPKELTGRNERERFLLQDDYEIPILFSSKSLVPAFSHPEYGPVWMTSPNAPETSFSACLPANRFIGKEGKGYCDENNVFLTERFFFKAPDGTSVAYRLIPDVVTESNFDSGVLDAIWNDGTVNSDVYEISPGGCGRRVYAYNETKEVDIKKDLVLVGKTSKGDPLYGYKNVSRPGFVQEFKAVVAYRSKEPLQAEELLENHFKVFWKDPFGRILAFYNSTQRPLAECGKPVLYLYPERPTTVSVRVFPSEGVRISDPDYGNGWKVRATPTGLLTDLRDGKTYDSLFWEGSSDIPYRMPKEGFVVDRNQLNSFFDEKLTELGLRGKEVTDFKEFWIPKMQDDPSPFFFVTFLSRDFIDRVAPLRIHPTPDTVIRILLDYEGRTSNEPAPSFSVRTPERKGFTVVEWGGMLK